ncbi:hypothetical protein E8E13_008919 [Curvularia kusanoi]|uniref:Uncharacterized protein n=1 Tax=Curvularia kusanoi TaxID=90978 RepID=A0A9P4WCY9_CURKU|nr:hypothetical protein E8E13_008919 [Curvularia kusanoi]
MTGVNLEHGYQQASNGKQLLNKDDLYFNDMDIRAWERRTAALGAPQTRNDRGYQEDEGYYDDSGELMSAAEYEEVLFQRVLDKIRLARAADLPDVQLTPEELDAYQSKLHGKRSPAARPSRNARSLPLNDTMSVANASTASKKGSGSSRSRKEQQKSSLFASKQKKEKPSSRKATPSNVASAPPPGFMVPGPDGQPIYTPITAYQGSLARDPLTPPPPAPSTAPISDQPPVPAYRSHRDMPGSFPGALPTSPHLYHSPLSEGPPPSPQPVTPSLDALGIATRSSKRSTAKSKASPVEPYQYHNFSSSSSTQSSPKPKYTRRVSSAESSYTAVPRRVPVPGQRPQTNYLDASLSPHAADLRVEREADRTPPAFGEDVGMPDVDVQTESGRRERKSGAGSKEERRRKGKSKRK